MNSYNFFNSFKSQRYFNFQEFAGIKKESDRLKIGSNILKLIGVKNQITNEKIKKFGVIKI